MRAFAGILVACALAACAPPPNPEAMAACVTTMTSARSDNYAPEEQEQAKRFAEEGCACMHRTLSPEDFAWFTPIFVEASRPGSRFASSDGMVEYLRQQPGFRGEAEATERLSRIMSAVGASCPPSS